MGWLNTDARWQCGRDGQELYLRRSGVVEAPGLPSVALLSLPTTPRKRISLHDEETPLYSTPKAMRYDSSSSLSGSRCVRLAYLLASPLHISKIRTISIGPMYVASLPKCLLFIDDSTRG